MADKTTMSQKLAEVEALMVSAWNGDAKDVIAVKNVLVTLKDRVNGLVKNFDTAVDHFGGEGKFEKVTRIHQPRGRKPGEKEEVEDILAGI